MRILTLSNCPLEESQGSGYVILNTARCLVDQGHEVDLVSEEEIIVFKFLKSRARIYRIMLGMAWWLITHKIKKYDLFIFYGAESFLAVFLLKKLFRTKSLLILHSNGLELMVSDNIKKHRINQEKKKWFHFDLSMSYKYCYNTVDKIITVSKSEKEFAINRLGLKSDKVFYNNLALPAIYFETEITNEKQDIIAYCGRWTIDKGAPAMAEAINSVLKKHSNYRFRMIGVGENFVVSDFFCDEVKEQIEIISFVEDKVLLMNLYSECSIFLFPSLTESFGLVVVEAMYCGCAVVCGPTGYAAEIINKKEGIILNKISKENIIKALDLFICNEKFRKEVAFNGQQKVSELTWSNYSIRLNSIMKTV
ncbi:glycosyltransferase family 4 protein [Flavobacterium ovatum]|uniref:glycosyltransferase family 4 protein n=1 Tax=Flavobacterium ovatum TaxID=1928857 RepID=UPI00344F07FE